MDLVVLAGTIGSDVGWARGYPRPLLPLGDGRTLMAALLERFDTYPDALSAICANGHADHIEAHLSVLGRQKPLILLEEGVPLGTAGCLRKCAPHLKSDTFCLAGGSVWLADDPQWMLEQHRISGNAITAFCTQSRSWNGESTRRLTPAGIYCCERTALQHIRSTGYFDLKEQWVPALRKAGLRVGAIAVSPNTGEVRTWPRYAQVLSDSISSARLEVQGFRSPAPGVWIGSGAKIAATARIAGPVLLGRGCVVESGALLVGPLVLGDGCRIGANALLERVVAPGKIAFPKGAAVSDRVVASSKASPFPVVLAEGCRGSKALRRLGPAALRRVGVAGSRTPRKSVG